jgi:hypothetical protein
MKVKLMSVNNDIYYNMPEGEQACTFTNKINAKMQALFMALVSLLPHYNHLHHNTIYMNHRHTLSHNQI